MKQFLLAAFAITLALSPSLSAQDAKAIRVVLDTSHGKITIELNADKAPLSVKNFLEYVDAKHYDGTTFHRVMSDFMIQGGGFEPGFKQRKTREPIKNEAVNGLSNKRGSIAMARTDNPDSATCQFFINVVDNERLDRKGEDMPGYAVFVQVIEGMDVVDKIRKVETETREGFKNTPVKDVMIKTARRAKG